MIFSFFISSSEEFCDSSLEDSNFRFFLEESSILSCLGCANSKCYFLNHYNLLNGLDFYDNIVRRIYKQVNLPFDELILPISLNGRNFKEKENSFYSNLKYRSLVLYFLNSRYSFVSFKGKFNQKTKKDLKFSVKFEMLFKFFFLVLP